MGKKTKRQSAYTKAGVDIKAAEKAVDLMKKHIRSTYTYNTLSDVGSFAGLFDGSLIKKFRNPVLVSSIDGVGTKLMVAEMMNNWTIGQDIVNHCVNDILTLGAKPLFFINYLASAKLKPEIMEKIVKNMAIACKEVRIPLITGETAEMPGTYQEGRHDVVGCITGVVEKNKIIDGSKIAEGDALIGLPSNGLHTNGYSLARKAFLVSFKVNTYLEKLDCTIGEELLRVHKCYFNSVYPLLAISDIQIHGIAHITGGGLIDNITRLLPEELCAEISEKWEIPPVFRLIQEIEKVSDEEMRRVFNLGIGMVLIAPFKNFYAIKEVIQSYGQECDLLGTTKKTRSKKKKVVFTY